MGDRYARWAPEAHVGMVPPWAEETYPHLTKRIIGPPRGHEVTGDIRAVEMLTGVEDGQPVVAAFLRIPREVAQRMADQDGGWVHLSTMSSVVFPFSMAAYVALDGPARPDRPGRPGGPKQVG